MRSEKKILILMLEHQLLFSEGLCCWTSSLYRKGLITLKEYDLISVYIYYNRPSKYSSLSAYINRNAGYYWKKDNIKPRLKWIKKQIEKL